MGIKELLEQLKGSELEGKLQGCESIDEFVAKAKELGYDICAEDVEKATDLSDENLKVIAGGAGIDPTSVIRCTC